MQAVFCNTDNAMNIKTSSELRALIAERCKNEPIKDVSKDLGIAEIYALQIVSGHRDVSKNVAKRMGYELYQQPKPEKLFISTGS